MQLAEMSVRDLPLQVNQLMSDLEKGRITVRTIDPYGVDQRIELRRMGVRIVFGVWGASSWIVGGLLIVVQPAWQGDFPFLSILGCGFLMWGSMIFCAIVLHAVVAARLKPSEIWRAFRAVARFFLGSRQ